VQPSRCHADSAESNRSTQQKRSYAVLCVLLRRSHGRPVSSWAVAAGGPQCRDVVSNHIWSFVCTAQWTHCISVIELMLQRNTQQTPISFGGWRIGASHIGGRITNALRFATRSTWERDIVGEPHSSCTSRCCVRSFVVVVKLLPLCVFGWSVSVDTELNGNEISGYCRWSWMNWQQPFCR